MINVSVSIVCYKNDKKELVQTINSVLNSNGINTYLYIIDNSPTNYLRCLSNQSNIEYVWTNKNIGFGAGHNIAIRKSIEAGFRYHLVLNPDIYFDSNVLSSIVKYMDLSNVSLLMPKIINPDGSIRKVRRRLPTPLVIFGRFVLPSFLFQRIECRYRTEDMDYNVICSAPFLSGCFMFFRTSELKRLGGFDERYFMYFEDADLSRRFYQNSKTVYFPNVSVVHLAHRESHKSIKLMRIHLHSAILYFNKWGWLFDSFRKSANK